MTNQELFDLTGRIGTCDDVDQLRYVRQLVGERIKTLQRRPSPGPMVVDGGVVEEGAS